MNRKFISKSNRVLRRVLNSKENLDILQDFIETFLEIQIEEIKLNPYLKEKSNNLPSEENFGIADVRIKLKNIELFTNRRKFWYCRCKNKNKRAGRKKCRNTVYRRILCAK